MLDLLPNEIIGEIIKDIDISSDLFSLKLVNSELCKLIKNFSIIKMKVLESFKVIKRKELCANSNCYNETLDVYVDNYREYEGRYIHSHQYAMNFDKVILNKHTFSAFSPYCHDCFKNHVLLFGIERRRIFDLSCEGFVDVEISNNL